MTAAILLAVAGMGALLVSPVVHAQTQAAAETSAQRNFDVRQGALGAALLRFGEQSGLQFSFDSSLTRGKTTAGVRGRYSIEDGLRGLLAGTGLTFRFSGPRTVVIEPLPDTGDARVLGPLRIEGANQAGAVSGINGSSDATATENTGSYTTGALSIASKTPTSIKDTPKTVSVITSQQLSDQNITDFTSMMEQATGITVTNGDDNIRQRFYSRGFQVETFRIDGGGPLTTSRYLVPIFDMAMYDHVELTRGADGLYSGYGQPGGVINLARKRPLDHNQVLFEAQAGSWNAYRVTADVTGPLGWDGRLRGRAVLAYEDKDFFYDIAHDNHTLAYGIVEADVTPELIMRAGFSFTSQRTTPWQEGLPRYRDGRSLGLPRSVCLCLEDAYYSMTTKELFLQADYQISQDWALNVNLTQLRQNNDTFAAGGYGAVDPYTGLGWGIGRWSRNNRNPVVHSLDSSLSGSFSLLGMDHKLSAGANYQEAYHKSIDSNGPTRGAALYYGYLGPNYPSGNPNDLQQNPVGFNPDSPLYDPFLVQDADYYDEGQKQYTMYANWSTTLWERMHLNVGLRYSYYRQNNYSQGFCRSVRNNYCDVYGQNENGEFVVVGQIGIGERFESEGVRLSNVDRTFSWPPQWSIGYDVSDTWSIYGSYNDIFKSQANNVDPNYDPLPPVTGFNVELGSKHELRDGKLNAALAAYYIRQDGFAVLLYDDFEYNDSNSWISTCCFTEGDGTRNKNISYGFDAELTGELAPGWQISAGYTFNRNKDDYNYAPDDKGERPLLTFAPKHLLKLWTHYQFSNGWARDLSVGAGLNAQTRTYTSGSVCVAFDRGEDPQTGNPTSECTQYDPFDYSHGYYSVVSAKAGYRINDNWSMSLNVGNVFDKIYYRNTGGVDVGNWYGEPRSYSLTLRGRF